MALSTSFSNFFPFLSPPSKSPQPPSQLPLLSPFPSHQNRNNKFIPLVLSRINENSSSSITSSSSSSSSSSSTAPPQDMSSSFTSSLSTSNFMFLASPYNVQIVVEVDEPEERFLNRFRREVMRAGIIQECKRRRFFENTQDEKKRRVRDAAKRNRRNKFPRRPMAGGKSPRGYNNYWQDEPTKPKEEDDDNWDLPEEDVIKF